MKTICEMNNSKKLISCCELKAAGWGKLYNSEESYSPCGFVHRRGDIVIYFRQGTHLNGWDYVTKSCYFFTPVEAGERLTIEF